jgi:hypothetical protein
MIPGQSTPRHGQGDVRAPDLMQGSITLRQMAERTAALAIACDRCDRAGRYSLKTLIDRYGVSYAVTLLLGDLSADCPKRISATMDDRCGIHTPDLSWLFLGDVG